MPRSLLFALALTACGTTEPVVAPAEPSPEAAPTQVATPVADPSAPLQAGDPAPDVTLHLQDGSSVPLGAMLGKQVLVYFYPKDDTPGCTVEAEGLRDGWADISAAGLVVYGVSMQDADSHNAFSEKLKLPFPLVVDVDGRVAAAFRVPVHGSFAARQSFLIGADGKIKQRWLDVNPRSHAAEILAAARQ